MSKINTKSSYRDLTLYLWWEETQKEEEIPVKVSYCVENNGIGPYEFWGDKCYDKGEDFVVIEECEWDKTGRTPEEIDFIEDKIEDAKNNWETEIFESLVDEVRYNEGQEADLKREEKYLKD